MGFSRETTESAKSKKYLCLVDFIDTDTSLYSLPGTNGRHRELAQQIQTSGRGMEAVEFEEKNKNNSEFWIESTQFAGAAEM